MTNAEKEIIQKHYKKIGGIGGKATVSRYGNNYMSDLVKKRWAKRKKKKVDNYA